MPANNSIDLLIAAAKQGRQKIREDVANTRNTKPGQKRDGSLLTEADLASQEVICSFLNRHWPGIPILSEETSMDGTDISTGQWLVVDPLDGTTIFTRGIPFYSVTIAYIEDGCPQAGVVMPVAQDYCYAAVKDRFATIIDDDFHKTPIRCKSRTLEESILCVTCDYSVPSGREKWWQWLEKLRPPTCFRLRLLQSSALELCLLAEGKIDGYLHPTDNPWDMAAAGLITQEAGGRVFGIEGGAWSVNKNGIIAVTPAITNILPIIL